MKRKYEVLQRVEEHEKEIIRALSVARGDSARAETDYVYAVVDELARELSVIYKQTIDIGYSSMDQSVFCCIKGYDGRLFVDFSDGSMIYKWSPYRIGINRDTGVQKPPYGRLFRGKIPMRHAAVYGVLSKLDRLLPDGLFGLGQYMGLRYKYYMTEAGATYIDTKRAFYVFIWGCGGLFPKDIVKYLGAFVLSR